MILTIFLFAIFLIILDRILWPILKLLFLGACLIWLKLESMLKSKKIG
jgi:hypothetical protein